MMPVCGLSNYLILNKNLFDDFSAQLTSNRQSHSEDVSGPISPIVTPQENLDLIRLIKENEIHTALF